MKRLIFLLDGTWNDAEFGDKDTNIVRLREILAKSLENDLYEGLGVKRDVVLARAAMTAA